MNALVEELSHRARTLSPEDRARLAEEILASLQDEPESEVEAEWDAEILRRLEQVKNGTVKLVPAEDVHAEARQTYRCIQAWYAPGVSEEVSFFNRV